RFGHVPLVQIAREHDDGGLRRAPAHLSRDLKTVQARHDDVDDEHLGLDTIDERDYSQAVRGFADHLEIRLHLEQTLHPFADHVLVVREHDPGRALTAESLAFLHGSVSLHASLGAARTAEQIRRSIRYVYSTPTDCKGRTFLTCCPPAVQQSAKVLSAVGG